MLNIIDSILKTVRVDLKKILKVVPDAASLVEPLLYNSGIDAYDAELKIYPYIKAGESAEKITLPPKIQTVRKSKKGPVIIITAVLIILMFLPLWLIIILAAFLNNQIKYGKKFK